MEGCEGSDVTSHIAWGQLTAFAAEKSARREGNSKSREKQRAGLLTEGSATLRLITWLWITVSTRVNAVVCDFLSWSLWGDSLTNCGSGGCINFLAPQAAVFSLIDFSSQMPHMMGRACPRGFFWGGLHNSSCQTDDVILIFCSRKCGAYLGTGLWPPQSIFLPPGACRNPFEWCVHADGLLWLFFHDKSLSIMEKGPSEPKDDKMDNKRGPASPLPLGATD